MFFFKDSQKTKKNNKSLKKAISRPLTVIFIPHHSAKPIRINFTYAFWGFLALSWLGITTWAVYLSIREVDYWMLKASNLVLKAKTVYFAKEVYKSREMLDQVKDIDSSLRSLLKMKSRQVIIEQNAPPSGGPTADEQRDLENMVQNKMDEITNEDIRRQLEDLKSEINEQISSYREIQTYIKEQRDLFRSTPNIWPCYGRITSSFGMRRHPWGYDDFHGAIDIAAEKGTPIRTAADGIVKHAGWSGGYGKVVVIEHGFGFRTIYGHNSTILVKYGQSVKRGQVISYMGETGHATGVHLHYEVRVNGQAVDPLRFIKK